MKINFPLGKSIRLFYFPKINGTVFLRIFILSILSLSFTNDVKAQEQSEVVYKDWLFTAERSDHVDISTRIIKCENSNINQVHLFIFNEGSENPNVNFTVTIKNESSNESFSTSISQKVERAMMLKAECGDKTYNNLKIDLPGNYDPATISLSITFN